MKLLLAGLLFCLMSCASEPPLKEGPAFVDKATLSGSTLNVSGNLPTPCHQARWRITRGENEISVNVYSVYDPGVICAQSLEPFEISVPLEGAKDTVLVNGEKV